MADLLPSSPDPAAGDGGEPKVIGVDSEDADDLLAALQSETARDVLATLYDDPATPSALAEEVDTSIQNVRYHLDRLTDADLVEVADTIYSEKGREMKVYAPAAKPLVVFAGNDDETSGIEAALSRLLGGLGILGLSSLAVQRFFGSRGVAPNLDYQLSGGSDAAQVTTESENVSWSGQSGTVAEGDSEATTAQEAQETASGTATETATDSGGGGTNGDGGGVNGGDDGTTAEEAAETTRTVAETTQTAGDSAGTVTEEATTATESATTVTDSAATATDSATTVTESPETVTESARTVTESSGTATETAAQSTTTVVEAAGSAMGGLPPGLVFFAGGLAVLLALGAAWYLRAR